MQLWPSHTHWAGPTLLGSLNLDPSGLLLGLPFRACAIFPLQKQKLSKCIQQSRNSPIWLYGRYRTFKALEVIERNKETGVENILFEREREREWKNIGMASVLTLGIYLKVATSSALFVSWLWKTSIRLDIKILCGLYFLQEQSWSSWSFVFWVLIF